MNATDFQKLLSKLDACEEARKWAEGKSWEEVYKTCHQGDWLLWLFKKTNPLKIREITLAKAHCASLARKWMKDQRSISAIDVAIRFGQGEATKDELAAAASAAAYVAADAAAAAAYAAAYAAAAAARKESLQKSADICRQYLPIEIWGL